MSINQFFNSSEVQQRIDKYNVVPDSGAPLSSKVQEALYYVLYGEHYTNRIDIASTVSTLLIGYLAMLVDSFAYLALYLDFRPVALLNKGLLMRINSLLSILRQCFLLLYSRVILSTWKVFRLDSPPR